MRSLGIAVASGYVLRGTLAAEPEVTRIRAWLYRATGFPVQSIALLNILASEIFPVAPTLSLHHMA